MCVCVCVEQSGGVVEFRLQCDGWRGCLSCRGWGWLNNLGQTAHVIVAMVTVRAQGGA